MLQPCSETARSLRRSWREAPPMPGHPRVREFASQGRAYIGVAARTDGTDLFRTERSTVKMLSLGSLPVALRPVVDFSDLLIFPKARTLPVPPEGGAADEVYGDQLGGLLARVHARPAPEHRMEIERVVRMPLTVEQWAVTPERVVRFAASLAPFRDELEELEALRAAAFEHARPLTVHGDFKPDNVVLDDSGLPMAIDWEMSGAGPVVEDFAALWAGLLVELLAIELARGHDSGRFGRVAGRVQDRLEVITGAATARYEEDLGAAIDREDLECIGLLRLIARIEALCRARSSPSVEEVYLMRALVHGLRTSGSRKCQESR